MKSSICLVLILATACMPASGEHSGEEVTPVQKVIELLNAMLEKGKKSKYEEQLQFNAYKQFCDDTSVETKRLIAEGAERIAKLEADIEKYTAFIAVLTKEIAVLQEHVAVWTGDVKAATKVRNMEKDDYDAMYKDYVESLDALERAIDVLKKQAKDRAQTENAVGQYGAVSLTQVSDLTGLRMIPDDAKRMIDAFLAQDPDSDLPESETSSGGPPEASGYDFQSHGIIEMLEKLLSKFTDELTDLEKREKEAVLAFELLLTDLKANIEVAKDDISQKTVAKAKTQHAKKDAEAALDEAQSTKEADEAYLADLLTECKNKALSFKDRQMLRTSETEAIEKAIEILSSAAVTGNAEKHLPTLLQSHSAPKPPSLAQLRTDGRNPAQLRVAQFLASSARELDSRVLAAIAVRVEQDPFKKVKKMIKDLIARLMEEAAAEADHKDWCDAELSVNEQTRKEKTEKVEMLHAEADELTAAIALLTEEIEELVQGTAELDAAMAKATAIRQAEKAKNTETLADAKEAQEAVEKAVTTLKEFYAKAAEATALLQDPRERPVKPATFDEPYTGMQAENGGVIGMLEVIATDFVRLESETAEAEASAQKAYEKFMADSQADKAAKETDIEHKTAKMQDKEQALTSCKEDLVLTQKELDSALAYFDKLKPSCINAGVSYDERVAMRKEEVASLQEALKILDGETV